MEHTIYIGNTLEVLKTLPDESVDCVVTSPPYWGLRDYGEQTNTIWDGNPNCEHEWEIGEKSKQGMAEPPEPNNSKRTKLENLDEEGRGKKEITYKSGFCKKCGAWYGQLGLEPTLDLYLKHMLQITAELKRVLKKTGVMFWNHGDSYSTGSHRDYVPSTDTIPAKSLCLQNYRLVLRMIDEQSWILRNVIIWHKPNHMPSSVKDRFTNAYEPVFMLVKNKKYWFDLDAVRVPHKNPNMVRKINKKTNLGTMGEAGLPPHMNSVLRDRKALYNHPLGKNPGDLWTIPTQPFPEAHFATYPEKLVEPMIKAGCPKNGITLDPFAGSGTTMIVAEKLGRNSIGIELNPNYVEIIKKRFKPYLAQAKLNGKTELKIIHTGDVNGRNCGEKI